jgi:hypothetical protein
LIIPIHPAVSFARQWIDGQSVIPSISSGDPPDTMFPLAQGSLGFMGANEKKSRGDRVVTM